MMNESIEIRKLEAEIAAMAKLAVLLKADITGKDAEIERLKKEDAKVVKELQALARLVDSLIAEKDAEIERLKVEIFDQQEQRFWMQQSLSALLKRAADALEHESWVSEEQCGLPSQFVELIAELRKAAE